jgi:hypothetical protein
MHHISRRLLPDQVGGFQVRGFQAGGFGTPLVFALGLLAGSAVGSLTDILQAHITGPFAGLVNAVSPWLVPAFATGSAARRARTAALAGILACLCELAAYVITAESRAYAQSF